MLGNAWMQDVRAGAMEPQWGAARFSPRAGWNAAGPDSG